MVTPSALVLLCLQDERFVLGLRVVEMPHVARGDHRLDLTAKHLLQSREQVDFEVVGILEDLRVEKDLVGFAKAEVEFVLVQLLFVCLA